LFKYNGNIYNNQILNKKKKETIILKMSEIKINNEDIVNILNSVYIEEIQQSITDAGWISSIIIKENNKIGFSIEISKSLDLDWEAIRKQCEQKVRELPGVSNVTIVLTSEKNPDANTSYMQRLDGKAERKKMVLENIKRIILVASCKGGVGKSTTAVNISVAVSQLGYKVGLLDADIYGPSIPQLLNIKERPVVKNNKIMPIEKYGIETISIGNLIPEDSAAIWRGPMITKAMFQLINGVEWGSLDVLFIDMPPGTGDIYLSLLGNFEASGAIIVSTPQTLAIRETAKSVDIFNKLKLPLLGIIENMSYFVDPISKNKNYIFGKEGVRTYAMKKNIKFLGEVPIMQKIVESCEEGEPISYSQGIEAYNEIAKMLISILNFSRV
jgi:ATP-binding protein involved in chromosome partitioning